MPTRVAINGFGRTGRATFRAAYDQGADIEWVGINDVMDVQMLAHLLRHDSVYGPFPGKVEVVDNNLVIDDHRIPVYAETDPAELPWGDIGAEVVIESSGFFRDRAGASKHLEAGARKVIVSAPAKQLDITSHWGSTSIRTMTPSCTTSSPTRRARPTASPGGEGAARDARHPPRRHDHGARLHRRPAPARRPAQGLPPRAQRGCEPRADLDRRRQGHRPRHPGSARQAAGLRRSRPRPDPSLVDLTVELERETSVQAINQAMRERADNGGLRGILYYSEEPSSPDIVKSSYSSIFDAGLTIVTGGTQVKVVAWYDNEWGYSSPLDELAQRVLVPVPQAA